MGAFFLDRVCESVAPLEAPSVELRWLCRGDCIIPGQNVDERL